jgi:hypothetical protein
VKKDSTSDDLLGMSEMYILFRLGSLSLLLTNLFMKFFDLSSERSNTSSNYNGCN